MELPGRRGTFRFVNLFFENLFEFDYVRFLGLHLKFYIVFIVLFGFLHFDIPVFYLVFQGQVLELQLLYLFV